MPRVYFLWQTMFGYAAAGMRAMVDQGAEVRILHQTAIAKPPFYAPFDDAEITKGLDVTSWEGSVSDERVNAELDAFQPDVLVINSWHVGAYRRAGRRWRGKALRIVVMDHQWHGTPKQWAGRLARRFIIEPAFDAALLPGDEQAVFARHLGFEQHEIIFAMNTCDDSFFTGPQPELHDRFLFAGRLVDTKGVDVLAQAYAAYRASVPDPWPLTIVGTGHMSTLFDGIDGVTFTGFLSPDELPPIMAEAGCFVLPSRFEPWGVVIHEAAASGLPVVCSSACGAASRLVLDGYNGRVVAPGDAEHLAQAMAWVADASPERRRRMGVASTELARQYTPTRWAEYLLDRSMELLPEVRRSSV